MLVPTKHVCCRCKKVYCASIWCPECLAKNLAAIRNLNAKLKKKLSITPRIPLLDIGDDSHE